MFNCINNPNNHREFISSCLFLNSSYLGYQTKTNSNLSVICFNRTASQSAFVYQRIKNWNKLPISLKIISKANFKIKLTNHFCELQRRRATYSYSFIYEILCILIFQIYFLYSRGHFIYRLWSYYCRRMKGALTFGPIPYSYCLQKRS